MKHIALLTLLLIAVFSATPVLASGRRGGLQPAPRLLAPSDHADLREKKELLFRWGNEGDRSGLQEYQFKLYKGTQTVESNILRAEKLPVSQDHFALPAELFEDGGTYAWQLRGSGPSTTRSAYSIFKVQK